MMGIKLVQVIRMKVMCKVRSVIIVITMKQASNRSSDEKSGKRVCARMCGGTHCTYDRIMPTNAMEPSICGCPSREAPEKLYILRSYRLMK